MKSVIACIDGLDIHAEAVCDLAVWSSQQMQAPLTLLHVLDREQYPVEPNLAGNIGLGSREGLLEELTVLDEQRARLAREQGQLMLNAAAERVQSAGLEAPSIRQRHGDLVDTLTDLEPEMRLLIMGRQTTLGDRLGTHLESCIRSLHQPILVAQDTFKKPERFLLAYDGSATANKVVDLIAAGELLKDVSCELIWVGAVTNDKQAELEEVAERLRKANISVNAEIRAGDAVPVLLETVVTRNCDLLVMGAYGQSRIRQWLVGSTTTQMLKKAKVPLLLLR